MPSEAGYPVGSTQASNVMAFVGLRDGALGTDTNWFAPFKAKA